MGLRHSLNTFAYVDSEPLTGVDPLGLGRATGTPRPSHWSWSVGGCLVFQCIEDDGDDDGPPKVSMLFPPELGGGIKICNGPDEPPPCGNDPDRDIP